MRAKRLHTGLHWTSPELQYSISAPSVMGKNALFRDVPARAAVFKGFSASIIPHEILEGDLGDGLLGGSHELLVHFRLAMVVGDARLFGYA